LFVEGSSQLSVGGLIMMMLGVVFAVTAVAGVCLVEEAVNGWRAHRGRAALPARPRAWGD
jgi:hypothetical protein